MLHTDSYYRGYRLSLTNEGKPTEAVHIRFMGDPDLIAAVPTKDQAHRTIDGWLNAP